MNVMRKVINYFNDTKRALSLILSLVILSLYAIDGNSQTPGLIYQTSTGTVMDPNGDGWVSQTTAGFQSNDLEESELPYARIALPFTEPNSDPNTAPDCGFTDIVTQGGAPILMYNDGTNLLFRYRIGKTATNSKGYSILIDTDQKFGFSGDNPDPDAVVGNLGFELEVTYETNFGVGVYSYVGLTQTVVVASTVNPESQYAQRSIAITEDCGTPDYFYEFYIPISVLGISSSTPLRFAAITVTSPDPSIGRSNVSDIGGIDDDDYDGNTDEMYEIIIEYQTPTSLDDINDGIPARTDCPSIDDVLVGATSVTGTSNEANGTVIEVFKDDVSIGTTTVSGGIWELTPITALVLDEVITATATADEGGTSLRDCDPETVTDCTDATVTSASADFVSISGGKGFRVTIDRPIGTVVSLYDSDYTLTSNTILSGSSAPNPYTTVSSPETFDFECQTGNCFQDGVYHFTYESPDSCISDFYTSCLFATIISAAPAITTTTITTSTTSISGTGTSASSEIYVYADGRKIASTTAGGTSPYSWTVSVSGLSICEVISAKQIETDECLSPASNTVTVTEAAVAPTISQDACGPASITSVSGFSVEETGTTITLYKVTAGPVYTVVTQTGSVTSTGTWTVSGISPALTSGEEIVATATDASNCKTESDYSSSVTLSTQTTIDNGVTFIDSPIVEGATTITGEGVNGEEINLYIDESTPDGVSSTTVSSGVWSISVNADEVYIGADVTITTTAGGSCESVKSNAVTVQCDPPTAPLFTPSSDYCYGGSGSLTVSPSVCAK